MQRTLNYTCLNASTEGILTPLVPSLTLTLAPSSIDLTLQRSTGKKFTLWFRRGAKRIFYVSVVRKTGRCVVQMGGINPGEAMNAIRVCRDHFDNWFQISSVDIQRDN